MAEGKQVNELELIFLPLMQSQLSPSELLKETVRLGKLLPEDGRTKGLALTLVMANRVVEPEYIDTIWEDIQMLKVIKYAEEKGMEKGIEKGIERGKAEGREEGKISLIKRQLAKKFGYVAPELLQAIDTLDEPVLDTLSIEILDMQKPEELRKFIRPA